MFGRRKITLLATTGVMLVATVVAGVLAAPKATQAAASNTVVEHRGFPGTGDPQSDTYLADALGITADELATAQETARVAGIDQALEQGLITQAQADALRSNKRFGFGERGMFGFFGVDTQIDREALLANALGITVEKLQEAQKAAEEARLAQAVTDGRLSQEQADMMKAQQALQTYLQDKGFFADAVKQAVADGIITQAQADTILSRQGPAGMWGFGRGGFGRDDFGGRGGRGGFPGFENFRGQQRNAPAPQTSGSNM